MPAAVLDHTPRSLAPMVCMARQPIVDLRGRVHAYELLHRSGPEVDRCTIDGDRATAQVLTDTIFASGLATIGNGAPLFVNFTPRLLVDDAAFLLPAAAVVIEVTEDTPANEHTLAACRRLRDAGYRIALDDFVEGSEAETFLPYASYVKVDVLGTPFDRLEAIARRCRARGQTMLAEKVEDRATAARAAAVGYELFQGYFFARPTALATHAVSPRRTAYLDLLAAVHEPDITISKLEALVKRDASLSHGVLRCLQSASWGLRREVSSIRQALILLGVEPVRRWTAIWSVAGLNGGGATEIVNMALIRARMCERLAALHWGADAAAESFLLGLCSLLDVLLQAPMPVAIADLPLPVAVREALAGTPGRQRSLLECVLAYEQGDWLRVDAAAQHTGLEMATIPEAYADALSWVAAVNPPTAA